jgi:hypothetical protein
VIGAIVHQQPGDCIYDIRDLLVVMVAQVTGLPPLCMQPDRKLLQLVGDRFQTA